ncbi:MAG: MT-A70 family methyltransferase [Treponema sp.]|nr:MT-A70 family methyltransferase [Treponema sp.]
MKYQIVYADPPWAYLWGTGKDGGNFAPEKHYQTMSTDEICDLNVKALRDKNCALFLWATMPALPDAFKVISAWGFTYKTCAFSWVKTRLDGEPLRGMGSYTKSNIEICLLGMRGHIKAVDKTVPQIVMYPRLGHSVKPPVVRDRIVQLFGELTRIELFSRQRTPGWDAAGFGIDGISLQEKISTLIDEPNEKYHLRMSENDKIIQSPPVPVDTSAGAVGHLPR